MRVIAGTLLLALLCSPLAGCSDTTDPAAGADPVSGSSALATEDLAAEDPAGAEVAILTPLWEHELMAVPSDRGEQQTALSQGHLLVTGSIDTTAGMDTPSADLQLDYGIGDTETGEFVVVKPLGGFPHTVQGIPDTDLFLVVAADRIGVLDPAEKSFLWTGRTLGDDIVGLSATRIWMGQITPDGDSICRSVDTGTVVRHDRACNRVSLPGPDPDGVRISDGTETVDLPAIGEVQVPVTSAYDIESSTRLWSYGGTSVTVDGDGLAYEYSTFVETDLGLVRIDYLHPADDRERPGEGTWADAVLHLVDVRTGEVLQTFGRVERGTLIGFAGDVAVFEQVGGPTGRRATGYRLAASG